MDEHVALYRKYRPQTFDDIVGQKAPVTTLRQTVIEDRIGHAYLFCGQHGSGKTTIAKVFSRAVNCEHPVNGNPCNECPTCKGILNGSILDVIEMDAASNNSVENIRQIVNEVSFAPSATKYKVYIIDEVHMLSTSAFNALLKTLEEPPKHVIFLFATTEVHKIPATILSRCQRYDFKRIPEELISSRLRYVADKEGIDITGDAIKLITAQSDGALRDALTLLDTMQTVQGANKRRITDTDVEQATGTVDNQFLFKTANALIDGSFEELIDLCAEIRESGRDYTKITLEIAHYFRDLLVIRVKADPLMHLPYTVDTIKQMYLTANKVNAETLVGMISFLSKSVTDFKVSPDIPTSFELMMLRLCGRKSQLEVSPLVIPDFEKLQAQAASGEMHLAGTKEAEVSKVEKEEKSIERSETESEEPSEPEEEISLIAPEVDEDEEEEEAEELPHRSPFDKLPFPKDEPEEEQSFFSALAEETESEPAPVFFTAPAPEPKKSSILSGLSDSFLDDLMAEADKKEVAESESEPESDPEPEHLSQIATQLDKNPLIVDGSATGSVRTPVIDPAVAGGPSRWETFLSEQKESFPVVCDQLGASTLKEIDDSSYIVFEDTDETIVNNLKRAETFRRFGKICKEAFSSAHLFICTDSQYRQALKKHEEEMADRRAQELIDIAKAKGINTTVHFGDED
ncbi:MAG: DNA polymerase III subunit gamma/tau [Saccharofermentans sp.]|nr:DNA polymerase III subunit gamma/tau [Saccharofermentans sp.]